MEAIEFYLWDGQIRYRVDGVEHTLRQEDREIIEFVLNHVRRYFPDAMTALNEVCNDSAMNKYFFDYRRADQFIRCNFSAHDTLKFDISDGVLNFEEIPCPRRGVCKYEGRICKPKLKLVLPEEERKVAVLYSRGFTADEIASKLRKKVKTVKNQLNHVTKRLHLNRTKDLIKIFSVYNGFTLWE